MFSHSFIHSTLLDRRASRGSESLCYQCHSLPLYNQSRGFISVQWLGGEVLWCEEDEGRSVLVVVVVSRAEGWRQGWRCGWSGGGVDGKEKDEEGWWALDKDGRGVLG